jgi:hypothetical protein
MEMTKVRVLGGVDGHGQCLKALMSKEETEQEDLVERRC